MQRGAEREYWDQDENGVLQALRTSRKGLTENEIELRHREYGYNQLKKKKSVLLIALRQLKNPLLWLLLVTSIVSMFFGDFLDGIIIIILVLLTALVSFIQEFRSEKIVDDLTKKISYKTIVMRNNEKVEIDVKNLVPGDIVYLNIGSKVPADLRLIESQNLEINEAALTGESVPVHKISDPLKEANKIQDYSNYAFAGTIVSDGEALGVVLSTGNQTKLGEMSKEVLHEKPEIEFQKGINKFVSFLIKIVLVLTVFIAVANILLRQDIITSLLLALAVAIGIAPEMLPVILTMSMSIGARNMSKKEVLVKRLVSIEDFGNIDILCTDKTGTITEGNIEVHSFFDYSDKVNEDILLYSVLCNSAISHGKKIYGNSIDAAILKYAGEKWIDKSKSYSKIETIPFDYERKKMSIAVGHGKDNIFITKGAVYSVLESCTKINLNGRISGIASYKKKIDKKFLELSNEGLRVIAIAYKNCERKKSYDKNDEKELIFLGFITLSDPPRKTVKESLKKLKSLDIDFKILTGDDEIITQKIAEDVGIKINKMVLGDEIEKLDDKELQKIVEEADVFCRLTPHHKQRIIKALKERGHDVGYMGDGINDIEALHEADVGISVDSAVDVAKDASDIILLRKDLGILAEGVAEGRKVFGNSIKYILIQVSSDFGNNTTIALSSFVLPFLPILPTQLLFQNLLYDSSQFSISGDNVDQEYLKKPKKFDLSLIRKFMLWFGLTLCIYNFITFAVLIFVFKFSSSMFQSAWFIEMTVIQIFAVFILRTRRSPFWKSKPGKGILISCLVIAAAAIIVPYTPLGQLFQLSPLPMFYLIFLAAVVIVYLLILEVGKKIFFSKYEL